jgi:hypothetical protein
MAALLSAHHLTLGRSILGNNSVALDASGTMCPGGCAHEGRYIQTGYIAVELDTPFAKVTIMVISSKRSPLAGTAPAKAWA